MVSRYRDGVSSRGSVAHIHEQGWIDNYGVSHLAIRVGVFGCGGRIIESLGRIFAPVIRLQNGAKVESSVAVDGVAAPLVVDSVVEGLPADGVHDSRGKVVGVVHVIRGAVGVGIEAVNVESRRVWIGNDGIGKRSSLIEVAA